MNKPVANKWLIGKYNRIIKIAGNIIAVLCIVYILKTILDVGLNKEIVLIVWNHLFLTFCIAMMWGSWMYINAFNWNNILNLLEGKKISFSDISKIYITANIAKYLPGNVMHFVGRNLIGKKYEINQFSMAVSTIIEIGLSVFVTLFFSLLFLREKFIAIFQQLDIRIYYFIIPIVFVIGMIIFWINRENISSVLQKIFIPLTKEKIRYILLISGFNFFNFVLIGTTFYLSMRFVMELNIDVMIGYLPSVGFFLLSWLLGYIVPGSAGGIGVREFVLMLLLNDYYSKEIILTIVIIHRLITILGDLLAYLIMQLYSKSMQVLSKCAV